MLAQHYKEHKDYLHSNSSVINKPLSAGFLPWLTFLKCNLNAQQVSIICVYSDHKITTESNYTFIKTELVSKFISSVVIRTSKGQKAIKVQITNSDLMLRNLESRKL